MKITMPALLLGLLIHAASLVAAWHLMMPAALCWIPVKQAVGIGLPAIILLACSAIGHEKAEEARRNAEAGKLPQNR